MAKDLEALLQALKIRQDTFARKEFKTEVLYDETVEQRTALEWFLFLLGYNTHACGRTLQTAEAIRKSWNLDEIKGNAVGLDKIKKYLDFIFELVPKYGELQIFRLESSNRNIYFDNCQTKFELFEKQFELYSEFQKKTLEKETNYFFEQMKTHLRLNKEHLDHKTVKKWWLGQDDSKKMKNSSRKTKEFENFVLKFRRHFADLLRSKGLDNINLASLEAVKDLRDFLERAKVAFHFNRLFLEIYSGFTPFSFNPLWNKIFKSLKQIFEQYDWELDLMLNVDLPIFEAFCENASRANEMLQSIEVFHAAELKDIYPTIEGIPLFEKTWIPVPDPPFMKKKE